jgi:hypothetical protein
MLSNKIIADRPLAGNENRSHIHKGGRYQEMQPCDGSGSAVARPANDLPMPLRGDLPLDADPHSRGRSNNLSQKPFEKSGAHYAEENRRRIFGRDVKYR